MGSDRLSVGTWGRGGVAINWAPFSLKGLDHEGVELPPSLLEGTSLLEGARHSTENGRGTPTERGGGETAFFRPTCFTVCGFKGFFFLWELLLLAGVPASLSEYTLCKS